MMDSRARALALHRAGEVTEADAAYRAALNERPQDAELLHFHAALLAQQGRLQDALHQLYAALEVSPERADSVVMLALCLRDTGAHAQAVEAAERAVRLAPEDPLALMTLGSLSAIRGEFRKGEGLLRRCLALASDLEEASHWLGVALQGQGRWTEAADAYRVVARTHPTAHFNLGLCAERAGDLLAARAHYEQACRAMPGRVDVRLRLAQIHAMSCNFAAENVVSSEIEDRLADSAPLGRDERPEPFVLAFLTLSDAARQRVLDHHAALVEESAARFAAPHRELPPEGTGRRSRLRLGYLSPDFGEHAVGTLVRDVFAAHDRSRVEVYAYSLRRHGGDTAAAIRAGVDRFVDCEELATGAIVERIATDGIDVLIDLGSFTSGTRPEILALQPAPVQWAWLGFIHPHAAPWLDALILDPFLLPRAARQAFPDPVLTLATLALPGRRVAPFGPAERSRFGLPEGRILLAAFHGAYKISAELLEAWAEIAARVARATFVLSVSAQAQSNLEAAWRAAGQHPDQLLFVPRLAPAEHAARLACCDLFMDAFRYQAGATAIDAAAAGLPILSLAGTSPLRRLGMSVSAYLGLDELICDDAVSYVASAVRLCRDDEARSRLRREVTERAEDRGLFEPARTAAAIEALLPQGASDGPERGSRPPDGPPSRDAC